MLGKLLNERYLVLKELGSGGFSTTYLCRDSSLPDDPICVVKFMSKHPDLSDAEVEHLYLREADILYKLSKHPQIPLLLTRRIENEQRYLVIEYVEGDDLAQLLTQKRLSQRQIFSLLEGLFEVLKFIHSRQIIHRDIKPSNLIWRQSDQKLVLIDFGSAIDLTQDHQAQRFGTHGYMPPEQQDDSNLTFRSDLYTAGITAVELLTGVSPGQLPRNPETGEFVLEPLLKQHRVPTRLIEILTKLTRFQAKHRYANANQVLQDLKKLSRPQPAQTRNRSWIQHPVLKFLFAGTLGAATLLAIGKGQVSLPGTSLQNFREAIFEAVPRQFLPAALQPPRFAIQPMRSVQTGLLEQVVGGNELVTRDIEDRVTVWNWNGTRLIQLPARPQQDIRHMVLSPNGNRLALLYNQEIQVWSLPQGELKRTIPLPIRSVQAIALGIDGVMLAMSDGHRIQVWDLREPRLVQEIDTRAWGDRITFLSYLPNNLLACGSPDFRLHLWDAMAGRRTQTFAGHQATVTQAQLSANQQQLYTLGQDRMLTWNWQNRSIEQVLPPQSGGMVQLATQNQHLIGLHSDGRLSLWNSNSGRLLDAHAPYSGLVTLNGTGTALAQSQNNQLTFYSINLTTYGNP